MTTNKFYRKDAIINVSVVNLAEYNISGKLIGGWVSLPIEKSDFKDFIKTIGNPKRIGLNDCYVNNSAFNGLKIEDYISIQELNEVCKRMERIDPCKVNIFNALYEALGDFNSALERLESECYIFYGNMTLEEVAQEYIEEYCDNQTYANDMRSENYYETEYGVIEIL